MKCKCAVCYVIPNDIFKQIAKNGKNKASRDLALNYLSTNGRLRQKRELLSELKTTTQKEGDRLIYSCDNESDLPGRFIKKESDKNIADKSAEQVYLATGIVRDFLKEVLGRNGFDDEGSNLIASVHYLEKYDNAFWDGEQMVYGDGDGIYFQSFTNSLAVTAHELFHGVVSATGGLRYNRESGALNESICDVFGAVCNQWQLNQTVDKANWIIGKGLFTSRVKGVGVRKLDAPGTAYNDPVIGKDPQPSHMNGYYKGNRDNGGVHINSSIPSLAFVRAAKKIGGYSWETMAQIWYKALTDKVKPSTNFVNFAQFTLEIANSDYPSTYDALMAAWISVGILKKGA